MLILQIAIIVALAGNCSSAVFLALTLLGARRFRTQVREAAAAAPPDSLLPPVSILKPVHGLEARLRENLESFFRQNYPSYEILFAADEADDAALPLVREVCARYLHIPSRILVTGRPPWPNPPVHSFHRMAEVAAYYILVTSDSDVEVAPDYLRQVVPPLLDPAVGMITCLYRGKNAGGFWSALDAIGMSVEMTAGVLVANLLEGIKFGLGPTIAIRRDALAAIGGYSSLGNYFSNDFVIGNLVHKAGYKVLLSCHVIDHVVPPMTFRRMWNRQVRWAKGTRYSRPKGHLGSGLIYAMPYGLLGCLASALRGSYLLAGTFMAVAVLNRVVQAWVVGWNVVRDDRVRHSPWLYPLRDLFGFFVWCASYLSTRAVWRNSRYQLVGGGRIELRQTGSSHPS